MGHRGVAVLWATAALAACGSSSAGGATPSASPSPRGLNPAAAHYEDIYRLQYSAFTGLRHSNSCITSGGGCTQVDVLTMNLKAVMEWQSTLATTPAPMCLSDFDAAVRKALDLYKTGYSTQIHAFEVPYDHRLRTTIDGENQVIQGDSVMPTQLPPVQDCL